MKVIHRHWNRLSISVEEEEVHLVFVVVSCKLCVLEQAVGH